LTCDEIYPGQPLNAFGRPYTILGVDDYTREFYAQKYGRSFELGSVKHPEAPEPVER
jgi:hypothetical protein